MVAWIWLMYRICPLLFSLSQTQISGVVDIMDIHMDMKAMDMLRLPKIPTCMDILMEITSSRHRSSKLGIAEKLSFFCGYLRFFVFVFLINKLIKMLFESTSELSLAFSCKTNLDSVIGLSYRHSLANVVFLTSSCNFQIYVFAVMFVVWSSEFFFPWHRLWAVIERRKWSPEMCRPWDFMYEMAWIKPDFLNKERYVVASKVCFRTKRPLLVNSQTSTQPGWGTEVLGWRGNGLFKLQFIAADYCDGGSHLKWPIDLAFFGAIE